ncbi:MAG: T9SS type A sorting domain-containing protein [Bacteroidetes bacterium]|nr:T9SS type A sorting domain-containing protein [Bacteroidota bacterium]
MRNYLLPIFLSALSATSALSAVRTSCPFIGGTAVYKARVLWAMYNPIMQYNDRLGCIQGQNKNGNSGYLNLDSLYEAQTNEKANILANQIRNEVNAAAENTNIYKAFRGAEGSDVVVLYPNPTTDFIYIESSKMGTANFILQDVLGKELVNREMQFMNGKEFLKLWNIANGLYTYMIKYADETFTGKLNIIK